jgi:2-isopropylmalate synthase
MAQVYIYDTTLRDGAQGEGVSFSLEGKLKVAQRLDELGIPYVEGGWPGSNAKDAEFFRRARTLPLKQARLAAFGSTRRARIPCEADPQVQMLLDAQTPVVTIVGKTWDLHVRHVLETTLEENLAMIGDTVRYCKAQGRQVFYDAEHYFDGYKANPDYALATVRAACQAGADCVILCETNGGALPWEVEEIVRATGQHLESRGHGQETGPSGGQETGPSGGQETGPSGRHGQETGPSGGQETGPSGRHGQETGPSGGQETGPSGRHGQETGPSGGQETGPSGFSALGIHTHDDAGLAVANALAAVRAGCVQVQGTVNGYGERVGNCNLCTLIPDLQLKLGIECLSAENLRRLTELSRFVSETANLAPNPRQPYVGASAFAHKGGIHVAAILKVAESYQHVDPGLVGNEKRVLVSELAGRGNLVYKAQEFGLDTNQAEVRQVLVQIKELESRGFYFEGAEASVELMLRRQRPGYRPPFELIDFTVVVEHRRGRGIFAEATVKVKVKEEIAHTVAEGNGPVNALDRALRKALLPHYPRLADVQLADYKVRILDSEAATAATTRVTIDTRNDHRAWSTVGSSTNIIEASWQALADSMEYALLEET